MKKQKVLVTGSSGQLGSELKDIWCSDYRFELYFLERKDLDLTNPDLIQGILNHYQPDYIIHSAAYTAVDLAEQEPDIANVVNHLATSEIAKYAGKNSVRLLYISTDYVFPGNIDAALSEDLPTDPINIYGATKLKGELAVQKFCNDAIIIRTAWVYSTYGKNFVKTMLNLMNSRVEINVVSDQIGSPTYAYDLAILIKYIIEDGKWVAGIYHYSNEGRVSWYDFAKEIRDQSDLDCKVNPIPSTSYPTQAKRPHYSLLSKKKVKQTFKVDVPEWKESLNKMLNKLNANQ